MKALVARSTRWTTLVLAVALAACSPDRPTALTEPFDGSVASALSSTSDCSLSSLSGFAKTYYGSASNISSADIKALGDACKAYVGAKGDLAKQAAAQLAANAAGFEIFKDVSSVARSREAYATAGANLVVGTLAYLDIGTASLSDIEKSLSAGGLFGVGGSSALKTIFARNDGDHWGILAAWNRDVLVYGYSINGTASGLPSASQFGAYDISTLPVTTTSSKPFTGSYSVGVCFRNYVDGVNTPTTREVPSAVRVQHTTSPEFLNATEDLCSATYASNDASFGQRLLAYAGRAASLFVPSALYAAGDAKTGVGGFGSDLSPFYTPNLGGLNVAYVQQPTDNSAFGGIIPPIAVSVTTVNGAIIGRGSTVVLYVANNSGSPAGAVMTWATGYSGDPCPSTAPAGSICKLVDPTTGVATFNGATTDKPGGYILAAYANLNGIESAPLNSNSFNMKQ